MSLIGSFFRKSKLNAAIAHVNKARKRDGAEADHHFDSAYKGFAEVISKDLLFTETLYNWGFALLNQAKTKSGDEALKLYREATEKFSFCRMVNPDALGAAIDGGVVYMDLARLNQAEPQDALYDQALHLFNEANRIQRGSASYNLACIYALRNDQEACLNALEESRDHGSLPSIDDILGDADLDNMKSHHWFIDFVESLKAPAEPEPATEPAVAEVKTDQVPEPVVEEKAPQPIADSDTPQADTDDVEADKTAAASSESSVGVETPIEDSGDKKTES
ncbi:MAG: hypothetical protein Kow0065_15480 [Methylomicrobium sp.]